MLFPELDRYNQPFVSTGNPDEDRKLIIDFWMNVYLPEGRGVEKTSYETYKTWSNASWNLFKYVKDGSGYVPDTNQQSVKIALVKNDPLEPQLEEFNMWFPHIKQRSEGYKWIDILEETCSEYGCYDIHAYPDKFDLMFTRHRRQELLKSFPGAAECLDYIRQHHYYEKGKKNGR